MASIFGDDGVSDLFDNDAQEERDELPGGDEDDDDLNQNIFGEDEAKEEGADGVGEGDGDGENAEGKPVKVELKKRAVRNPRPRLTFDTLSGPRGIHTIEDYYKDIKFKGKGYEKQDLDEILKRLQHWGHRMYPTYTFDDVLNNIERLGKKKTLQVHMSRYRLGLLESMKPPAEGVGEEDEDMDGGVDDEPFDEFDALLGEQIAISKLAPRTPAHSSHYGSNPSTPGKTNSTFATPSFHRGHVPMSTPFSTPGGGGGEADNYLDMSDLAHPLPTSQPVTPAKPALSSEQMAKIAENRRLAQERLRAKKLQQEQQQQQQETILEEE